MMKLRGSIGLNEPASANLLYMLAATLGLTAGAFISVLGLYDRLSCIDYL